MLFFKQFCCIIRYASHVQVDIACFFVLISVFLANLMYKESLTYEKRLKNKIDK